MNKLFFLHVYTALWDIQIEQLCVIIRAPYQVGGQPTHLGSFEPCRKVYLLLQRPQIL